MDDLIVQTIAHLEASRGLIRLGQNINAFGQLARAYTLIAKVRDRLVERHIPELAW